MSSSVHFYPQCCFGIGTLNSEFELAQVFLLHINILTFSDDRIPAETFHSAEHLGEVRLQSYQPQQAKVLAYCEVQQPCLQDHRRFYSGVLCMRATLNFTKHAFFFFDMYKSSSFRVAGLYLTYTDIRISSRMV